MSTARQIADEIRKRMEADKTPPGGLLGTEAELRARHGVSLATLRRAIRILEQRQLAVMRRGVAGGLYADQPSIDAAANIIAVLWERTEAARSAVRFDAVALDGLVLRRASARMGVADAAMIADLHANCQAAADPMIRSALAARREQAITQLTGNPVIVLGQAVMLRFMRNIIPFEELAWGDPAFTARTQALVDDRISALIAGDVGAAQRASSDYAHTYFDRLRAVWRQPTRHSWAEMASQSGNLPTLVSRAMMREIRERGWKAGEFLGKESELMQRYNVGRDTWRQALSILVEYSAVESRRGGAGGIYVAPVNRPAVMETVSGWLSQQGAREGDGLAVFAAIAPQHAAALFASDMGETSAEDRLPVGCAELIDRVLQRETSPLLALAALTVDRARWRDAPSIDLGTFRDAPLGAGQVRRAVLNHITALA